MTATSFALPLASASSDWVAFSGGELEAPKPTSLCAACRQARFTDRQRPHGAPGRSLPVEASPVEPSPAGTSGRRAPALCLACHRADREHQRRLGAAATLDTASDERFQQQLPFSPVDRVRLALLKRARLAARAKRAVVSPYVDPRRRAQIRARHTLAALAEGLRARGLVTGRVATHPASGAAERHGAGTAIAV